MAKSKETYGKKEKEKKRLKQLQEKKEKMDERKANKKKGVPLQDMLAYIDENGNLSNKPPDPRNKKVFKQEEMQISVPQQEQTEETYRTGVINYFEKSKGFGFINDLETNERIFFHINNLVEPLNESDKVQFKVEMNPRGPSAVEVSKLV